MKIAIYGDSFGANPIGVKDYSIYPYVGPSWWEILSSKYAITNYCEWSASLLFSTDQFLKTHEQYDKIIFLVTHPGRITVKYNNTHRHFVNYEYSTFWKKDAKKQGWESLLDAVLTHYKYIADYDYALLQHEAYLNLVTSKRPDTILIPSFKNSIPNFNGFCLCDVFDKEQQFWKIKYDVSKCDIRKGHLTNKNHEIFYNLIEKILHGVNELDLEKFTNPDLPKNMYLV